MKTPIKRTRTPAKRKARTTRTTRKVVKSVKKTVRRVRKAVSSRAKKASSTVSKKTMSILPFMFLTLDYYNSGSMLHSIITCVKDFLWPAAVGVAKLMNASPYQMLITNFGGLTWTLYYCFFTEHDDFEKHTVDEEEE